MKKTLTLYQLIDQIGISKAHLASLMNMPSGTFNNKLSDKQTAYHFTEEEGSRLKKILKDKAALIEITFNKKARRRNTRPQPKLTAI